MGGESLCYSNVIHLSCLLHSIVFSFPHGKVITTLTRWISCSVRELWIPFVKFFSIIRSLIPFPTVNVPCWNLFDTSRDFFVFPNVKSTSSSILPLWAGDASISSPRSVTLGSAPPYLCPDILLLVLSFSTSFSPLLTSNSSLSVLPAKLSFHSTAPWIFLPSALPPFS